MTNEDKQLLIEDLSARLPYGLKVYCEWDYYQGERAKISGTLYGIDLHHSKEILFQRESETAKIYTRVPFNEIDCIVLPYLRPMSSMTEEEYSEFLNTQKMDCGDGNLPKYEYTYKTFDWLNKKMFDYRGLIEKGIVLPAPDGMYN